MELKMGLLLFGMALICLGFFSLKNYYDDQRKEYAIVCGRVIRMDKKHNYNYSSKMSTTGFVPVFEYIWNGKVYQKEHRIESSKYGKGMEIVPASKYKEGDSVELRVYLDNPEYAIVNDEKNIKLPLYFGIPAVGLGLVCLGVSVMLWVE